MGIMEYYPKKGHIWAKTDFFDLGATLECGQFFRFVKESEGYWVLAGNRRVFISQNKDVVCFHDTSQTDFENFWAHLFDFHRDYGTIIGDLAGRDPILEEAAAFAPGIRIMNQEPWETLVCFIISANNRIPMIMKVVDNIASRFGPQTVCGRGRAMPGPEVLAKAGAEELMACKTGFRAQYIINAAEKVLSSDEPFLVKDQNLPALSTEELRQRLIAIKGVGVKIADCVLLFSLGRREVFPIDVWIGRAMRRIYFGGAEAPLAEIQALAKERFGEHAGYANQLIFHYARMNKMQ